MFNKNMIVQSVNETFDRTTFTVSEILNIGKYKYYNMRTERGNNNIFTTVNIDTKAVFQAPTNFTSFEEPVYRFAESGFGGAWTRLEWDSLIGKNVTQYEIQIKTDIQSWENADTVFVTNNIYEYNITTQNNYNFRVRGIGKEQVKGDWAYTECNATLKFVKDPIQNKTLFVELFKYNSPEYFFLELYKIGNYSTSQKVSDLIDTIEIIPNELFSNPSDKFVMWQNKDLGLGLQQRLKEICDVSKKNINIREVLGGYYKVQGDPNNYLSNYAYIDTTLFKNINGYSASTIFKFFDVSIGMIIVNNYAERTKISNFKLYFDINNYTVTTDKIIISVNGGANVSLENTNISIENIVTEFYGFLASGFSTTGVAFSNRISNCIVKGSSVGYSQCNDISKSLAENCTNAGYFDSNLLSKNTAKNCTTKYSFCYSSVSDNATYLIAGTGSDTVEGGFNV